MNFIGNDQKSKPATACQKSPDKVIMKWSVAANKQYDVAAAGFITTIWHFFFSFGIMHHSIWHVRISATFHSNEVEEK